MLILFLGGIAAPIKAAAFNFVYSSSPDVGAGPFSVITADVNGDGKPDLISANAYDDTLTVLTNNGNATFTVATTLSTGHFPDSVAAADVNRDGKVDLISVNEGYPGSLTVFTNNGNAVFALSAMTVVGHVPLSVVASDLNGDGEVDLVWENYDEDTLTVMTNNGTGAFGFSAKYAVGSHPCAALVVDVSGDGKPDLVCANYGGPSSYYGTLSILTNQGNGTFNSLTTVSIGNGPEALVTADLNEDGKPDVITANYVGSSLTVLTNTGNGVLTPSTNYLVFDAGSVAAADVNGDGKVDFVATKYTDNALTILTNDGSGLLAESYTLNVGMGPEAVVAADLDGDGNVDVVTANASADSLTVLLNSPELPSLNIQNTSNNLLLLSWSAAVPGFDLQLSLDLSTTNWVGTTNAVTIVGGINQVLIEPSLEHAYYRLFHP